MTVSWLANKIELWPIAKLLPCARNAHNHSASQIARIAASIAEYGFANPILVGSDGTIVAGQGRLSAAQRLGLNLVPVQHVTSLPPSVRRNGVKDCLCVDCGTEFTVRKDSNPVICRRCVSSRGGKSMLGVTKAPRHPCKACGKMILDCNKQTYCSLECLKQDKRVDRKCKQCEGSFQIYKSALSGMTNTAGNFCSLACYWRWMCNTQRVKGRGSQWDKTRKAVIKKHPFCAVCATRHRLQVHHILPYRITFDNTSSNLVPLCVKHHKAIESMTHDVELTRLDHKTMKLVMWSILREFSMASAAKILELQREKNSGHFYA